MTEREDRVLSTFATSSHEMAKGKIVLFYPWSLPATSLWGHDRDNATYELNDLRERTPADLAGLLLEAGADAQITAILELMAHGNPRKAAELTRELVKSHPVVERSIERGFGYETGNFLLRAPLERIPSKPEEYPKSVRIQYIQ